MMIVLIIEMVQVLVQRLQMVEYTIMVDLDLMIIIHPVLLQEIGNKQVRLALYIIETSSDLYCICLSSNHNHYLANFHSGIYFLRKFTRSIMILSDWLTLLMYIDLSLYFHIVSVLVDSIMQQIMFFNLDIERVLYNQYFFQQLLVS